jgi:hypothetical protein
LRPNKDGKEETMKTVNPVKSFGALAVVLAMAANLALAGNPNPKILPIGSTPYGMTYGEWGDAWWQWVMSIPADINPVADPTGECAAVGQSGPVWFLAGTYGGAVERTITIPAGKALFFPIYNALWINVPELGDNPWSAEQEAMIRETLAGWVDAFGPNDLTCEIDGQPVADILAYRCPTPTGGAFMVDLPENDVWGLGTLGLPLPGTYGPSIEDGIYLMVAPFSKGQHTIHFTAGTFLDVTYHLTVLK